MFENLFVINSDEFAGKEGRLDFSPALDYIRLFFSRYLHIYINKDHFEDIEITKLSDNDYELRLVLKKNIERIIIDKNELDDALKRNQFVLTKIAKKCERFFGFNDKYRIEYVMTMRGLREKIAIFKNHIVNWKLTSSHPSLYAMVPKEFASIVRRDARRSLAGYLYQIDVALDFWLGLLENGSNTEEYCVLLEFVEDVAIVPKSLVDEIDNYQLSKGIKNESKENRQHKGALKFYQVKLKDKSESFTSSDVVKHFVFCLDLYKRLTSLGFDKDLLEYVFVSCCAVKKANLWNKAEPETRKNLLLLAKTAKKPENIDQTLWNNFINANEEDFSSLKFEILDEVIIKDRIRERIKKKIPEELVQIAYNHLYCFMKDRLISNRASPVLVDKSFTVAELNKELDVISKLER
jgi:hypothetical protein